MDTDFLLEQDIHFDDPDHDSKILSLEKFREVAAEIGFSVYPLGDEESPAVYSHLDMESETGNSHSSAEHVRGEENRATQTEPNFPSYLSCRGCGQLRDGPLGPGIDLVGPYCLRCCKASREAKGVDFCSPFAGISGVRPGSHLSPDELGDDKLSKQHSCHLCGFSSRYANHVKRHMKTHNGEKPYNCPLCTYASAQLVNLQRHLRIHTGEKPYKCESCAFACSSLGNLKRHQRMHVPTAGAGHSAGHEAGQGIGLRPPSGHVGLKRAPPGPRASEERSGTLPKEVSRPTSNLSLGAHNSDYLSAFDSLKGASSPPVPVPVPASNSNSGPAGHQPPPPPPPPLCEPAGAAGNRAARSSGGGGVGGVSSSSAADAPAPPLPPSLFPFTCRLCGVVLEDEDGTSAQICAKCTLEMLTKDSSSPNSPGERSDKVYTCAACPFLTHYPNHLARHMKTHSGEKPYKCPQCDYASAHFDNLKRHHRVHTGEKPYKCHLCDYACGNLANLKRHQRVHSGAKPFQCAVCNYSCNQSMNLKRHMLRHTGEKPYKCAECGYTTGHWDNYKRHQKKHGLATDGWVKVPTTGHGHPPHHHHHHPPHHHHHHRNDDDEEDEEEEEEEVDSRKRMANSGQSHRKDSQVDMQYMAREGAPTIHPCYKLEIA